MVSIKSLRSHKIFGLAVFDLTASLIGMIALFLIAWRWHFPELMWWRFILAAIVLTIPFGIVFHIIFGTNTQLNYVLGLSYKPAKVHAQF